MHLASSLRQDALAILRSWISRRWDLASQAGSIAAALKARGVSTFTRRTMARLDRQGSAATAIPKLIGVDKRE